MSPEGGPHPLFIGPDPVPALGADLEVICADACGLEPDPESSLASFGRGVSSTTELLRLPAVQERLRRERPAVVVWKGSAAAQAIAADLGLTWASSAALISRRLENKRYFAEHAGEAGLRLPPTRWGTAGPELLEASRELQPPLIFQLAHGFSGAQTYRVGSPAELSGLLARFSGRSCRVASEVKGVPVTVTGVTFPDRVLVGSACRQLTGIELLTPHPLGSCGNDYSGPVPAADEVFALAQRCGAWLRREGHRGVFGLDLVVGEREVWCIEANCRLVASVPLFSLSARDAGVPGILRQHLAAFGVGEAPGPAPECRWSQLILYQRRERRSEPGCASAAGALGPGGEFSGHRELALGGPGPGEAALIVQADSHPGKELARLIFQGPALTPDGALRPELGRLARQLRSQLEDGVGAAGVS